MNEANKPVSAQHTPGPCLWMVCYKTSPDSQTYWNVYPAASEQDATAQAEREGLFQHGRKHRWTVPYNKAGMSVEQTYADHLARQATGSAA